MDRVNFWPYPGDLPIEQFMLVSANPNPSPDTNTKYMLTLTAQLGLWMPSTRRRATLAPCC